MDIVFLIFKIDHTTPHHLCIIRIVEWGSSPIRIRLGFWKVKITMTEKWNNIIFQTQLRWIDILSNLLQVSDPESLKWKIGYRQGCGSAFFFWGSGSSCSSQCGSGSSLTKFVTNYFMKCGKRQKRLPKSYTYTMEFVHI